MLESSPVCAIPMLWLVPFDLAVGLPIASRCAPVHDGGGQLLFLLLHVEGVSVSLVSDSRDGDLRSNEKIA